MLDVERAETTLVGRDVVTRPALEADVRVAVLHGAVGGGVFVAAVTELLGRLGALTPGWVGAIWAVVLVAALALAARRWRSGSARGLTSAPWPRTGLELAMLRWVGVVVVVTGVIALCAAPITYDSMTYHLARVAHWAQHGSVDFYPTHVVRQLYQPPWAEYAALHLFLLARGDRLVNVVQWLSMLASVVGVSLIARQLGAGRRGQLVSAFACATIPMGILQAATTQNDYVSALWLVCLVSALLALEHRPGVVPVLAAGASLGLALLTKGTLYVLAAPFVVAFVLAGRVRPTSRKLAQGAAIVCCALLLNLPHYARNLALFGAPLGPGAEGSFRYVNDAFWPSILASNALRNAGLHLGTPFRAVNAAVERAIEGIHIVIGIAPDDPRSTWPTTRFWVAPIAVSEEEAANGLHLVLLVAALAGAVWSRRNDRRLMVFAGCLVAAFLLFCLVVRWQPWHSRLHLPLFVLGAPLIGVVFERLRPAVLAVVLLALGASSAYFLTQNQDRPLSGRRSVLRQPWAAQRARHAGQAYVDAARVVASSGCRDVGLAIGGNDREYFLWALLADRGWRGTIQPVAISNVSARLPYLGSGAIDPCAIVREGRAVSTGLAIGARYYRESWSHDSVQVLTPAPVPAFSSDATSGPPAVQVLLRRTRFRPGDRLAVGLNVRNPQAGAAADLFVGIVLPDGQSAAFVGPSGLLSDAISLADAAAYPRALDAPPGFALSAETFLDFTVPSTVPPGTYQVFAALVKRRSPRPARFPPEDFLASDIQSIVLGP